jgi:hypothetical protein
MILDCKYLLVFNTHKTGLQWRTTVDKIKHTSTYIGRDDNGLEYIIYEYTRNREIKTEDGADYMPGITELATDDGRPVLSRRDGYVIIDASGDIPVVIDGIGDKSE